MCLTGETNELLIKTNDVVSSDITFLFKLGDNLIVIFIVCFPLSATSFCFTAQLPVL